MKNIIGLILGLSIAGSLSAQKPVISGYLGKTNYGSLKFNTGVRSQHPEKWKKYDEVSIANFDGFSMKTELEMVYGHVFSNNFVLEVLGGHNSTTIDLNYLNDPFLYQLPSNKFNNYHNYYGYPKITDWYTGIGTKFYRRKKGSLAPLGVYTRLGLNYHTYGITFNDIFADLTQRSTQTYYSKLFDYGTYYFRFIEINGSIGLSRAITDRIIYDVGMTAGWGGAGSGFFDHDPKPFTDYFETQLLDLLRRYHLVKMYGSVSYMF